MTLKWVIREGNTWRLGRQCSLTAYLFYLFLSAKTGKDISQGVAERWLVAVADARPSKHVCAWSRSQMPTFFNPLVQYKKPWKIKSSNHSVTNTTTIHSIPCFIDLLDIYCKSNLKGRRILNIFNPTFNPQLSTEPSCTPPRRGTGNPNANVNTEQHSGNTQESTVNSCIPVREGSGDPKSEDIPCLGDITMIMDSLREFVIDTDPLRDSFSQPVA